MGRIARQMNLEAAVLQVGQHLARIAQQLERAAFFGGAAVARRQHMRDNAEAIGLGGAAQPRQRHLVAAPAAIGGLGGVGQQAQPRTYIADRRRDMFRRGEQRFFAGLLNDIAGRSIEAGQSRTRRDRARGQVGHARLDRAALIGAVANRHAIEK